jgi:Holliday junction resolvase RusA-like endonuclease
VTAEQVVEPVAFHVVGQPAPQGSKRHVGGGRMIESSKKVAPWRQDVVAAALKVRPEAPLDGPLLLIVTFTLARPKSATKARWAPDRTPDLSKLVRSTEDAMTTAGIWADDARVVGCIARKVWPSYDGDSMPVTGAVVAVGPANRDEAVRRAFQHAAWFAKATSRGGAA